MSKPRYRWWSYARNMVRDYPKLIRSKQLSIDDKKDLDAVNKAIELTQMQPAGAEHVALIRRVYWGRDRVLIRDAALRIHVSQITAERWHGEFIRLVGKCRGFNVGDYFCAQDETGGQDKVPSDKRE